jgi:hypothetical protein
VGEYQEALAQVESKVDAGDADLGGLGFWRLVSRAKRDPDLPDDVRDAIGRIDRKAFESRVWLRVPVWVGNLLLLMATLVVLVAVAVALRIADGTLGAQPRPGLGGVILLAAAVGLSGAVHVPAHWFVGRLKGIRFLAYFPGGPLRIQPGIKADYASYLAVPAVDRASMHAAGALASKTAPFVVLIWALFVHFRGGWDVLPSWSLWSVFAFGLFQIVTDVVWSTRRSDWRKVRRELRIARELGEGATGARS